MDFLINERIQKLIKQCTIEYRDGNGGYVDQVDAEKLAKLIVRECVSTLYDMHMCQSVNNQNYPNSWHDAVDQGIDAIKEHFGVEE